MSIESPIELGARLALSVRGPVQSPEHLRLREHGSRSCSRRLPQQNGRPLQGRPGFVRRRWGRQKLKATPALTALKVGCKSITALLVGAVQPAPELTKAQLWVLKGTYF